MKASLLVFLVTFLLLAMTPVILAADALNVTIDKVEVAGIEVPGDVALEAGEVVPVNVYFTAGEDASDVEISVWIQGERSEGSEIIFRDLIDGRKYHARLSLRVPTDLDDIDEETTLYVRIETDEGNWEESYIMTTQRETYFADILFVEVDRIVETGTRVPVDIVVKNIGRHELDDLVVSVSIPELGIGKRAYFGDLDPTDDEDVYGEDAEDAVAGRLYLKIPATVDAGAYDLLVEAYNDDTETVVKKVITITGAEQVSKVLVPVLSKELGTGETTTYSLVIVNAGDNIGIYEVIPETAEGVLVSVSEPVVTVPAGSSRVVSLEVKAGSREGTYSFAVDVSSDKQLVDKAVMNANVVKGRVVTGAGNLTVLTVILAVIFVVLLIVLIVLLTRKPEKPEEFEESYY